MLIDAFYFATVYPVSSSTSSTFVSVTFGGSYAILLVFVRISPFTVSTPASFPSAPSMAYWQCSQDMSGATRIVDSILFSPVFVSLTPPLVVFEILPRNTASYAQEG